VSFTPVAERCFASGSITCDQSQFTAANAASWPDTPQDQQCVSGAVCNNHGPSFWSTKRLTTITTQYYNGSGYTKVDSYALGQQFSTLGDPALWLNTITRTGYAADGTSITLPPVSFNGQMMDNRVAGFNNEPSMARYRMTDITAETGEIIHITYSDPQCTATNVPAAPSQDTMRCFPVNWTLPFQTNQTLDYFHKYVTPRSPCRSWRPVTDTADDVHLSRQPGLALRRQRTGQAGQPHLRSVPRLPGGGRPHRRHHERLCHHAGPVDADQDHLLPRHERRHAARWRHPHRDGAGLARGNGAGQQPLRGHAA